MPVTPEYFDVGDFSFPTVAAGSGPAPTPSAFAAHSPADVIAQVVIDLGYGTDVSAGGAWPVYVGTEPQSPDNCITAYDTSGLSLGSEMRGGAEFERPGVQFRFRGKDEPTAYVKARQVAKALAEEVYRQTVLLGSASYLVWQVSRAGPILSLNRDLPKSTRGIYTLNVTATVEVLSDP